MTPISHSRRSFFELEPGDAVEIGDLGYMVQTACRGGMGYVLLLSQKTNRREHLSALGLKLALKAVLPSFSDSTGIALFKRELTVWSGFRHPNVIWLLEIVHGGDAGWVAAMDWCLGSLRNLLNEHQTLSVKQSTDILGQLIDGLEYAYKEYGVLHLDLKPENVLYNIDIGRRDLDKADAALSNRRFMVSDWGIASIKTPQLNAIAGLSLTSAAAMHTFNNMGTMLYMAPERFKDDVSSSIASDVFSLGMIYMELLTGRLPFRNNLHPVESLLSSQYLTDAEHLLRSASLPNSIRMIILSMIAFSPSKRPSSYKTLRSSLNRAYNTRYGVFARFGK